MIRPAWAALLLALLAGGAQALYEEQAAEVSWSRQHVGRVEHARFAFKGRARAFVATAARAVASLDLRSGDVTWRRVLAPGDPIDALVLLRRPAAVATLSGGGVHARAWQASDGLLVWDAAPCSPGEGGPGRAAPALLPSAGGLGPACVIVLCGARVQARGPARQAPPCAGAWSAPLSRLRGAQHQQGIREAWLCWEAAWTCQRGAGDPLLGWQAAAGGHAAGTALSACHFTSPRATVGERRPPASRHAARRAKPCPASPPSAARASPGACDPLRHTRAPRAQALAADDGRQLWEHELPGNWESANIELTPDREAAGGDAAGVAVTGVAAGCASRVPHLTRLRFRVALEAYRAILTGSA